MKMGDAAGSYYEDEYDDEEDKTMPDITIHEINDKILTPLPPVVKSHEMTFTEAQEKLIRDTYAKGATDDEFAVFMAISKARNLNPILGQVWCVKLGERTAPDGTILRPGKATTMVSIHGLRCIAERTGLRDGEDAAEFEYDTKGNLLLAKVRVYKKGCSRPYIGVAYLQEYSKGNTQWRQMPRGMLAKCASALAHRMAFPEDMSGLYVQEEMDQAEIEEPKAAPVRKKITAHEQHVINAAVTELDATVEDDELKEIRSQYNDIIRSLPAKKQGQVNDRVDEKIAAGISEKQARIAAIAGMMKFKEENVSVPQAVANTGE